MIRSWANAATRRFAEDGKSKFRGLDVDMAEDLLAVLAAATSLSGNRGKFPGGGDKKIRCGGSQS